MGEISVTAKILETIRSTFDKDYLFQQYVKQGIRDLIDSAPSGALAPTTLSPNSEDVSDDDDLSGLLLIVFKL